MQPVILLSVVFMVLHTRDVVLPLPIMQGLCKDSPPVCLLCRYRPQPHIPYQSCAQIILAQVDADFLGAESSFCFDPGG